MFDTSDNRLVAELSAPLVSVCFEITPLHDEACRLSFFARRYLSSFSFAHLSSRYIGRSGQNQADTTILHADVTRVLHSHVEDPALHDA
jgi:hypothetical protein